MKNGVKSIILFLSGVLLGGGITYQFATKKFAQRLNKEVTLLKKVFPEKKKAESNDNNQETKNDIDFETNKSTKIDYCKFYRSSSPTASQSVISKEKPKDTKTIIKPAEFITSEFEHMYCTYYEGDNVLTDSEDRRMDIEANIGSAALKRFGEYESEVVCVKNEEKQMVYEVTRDERSFAQVVGESNEEEED